MPSAAFRPAYISTGRLYMAYIFAPRSADIFRFRARAMTDEAGVERAFSQAEAGLRETRDTGHESLDVQAAYFVLMLTAPLLYFSYATTLQHD